VSRIDDLIRDLCPNGVEYKPLGELLNYEQPGPYLVSSKEYNLSYPTPVLTAGATFVLGHTNEKHGIYSASQDSPAIIFDDFTTASKWVDFPFKAKSSAMKILTSSSDNPIDLRYTYYVLDALNYTPSTHSRHWISIFSKMQIPFPPRKVREYIVSTLNRFKALEAELEAELDVRKQQYSHYLNHFFTSNASTHMRTLRDVGPVRMCKRIMKNQTSRQGDVPFYKIRTFGGTADAYISRELYNEYKEQHHFPKPGSILISAAGTIGRAVPYDGKDAYFQDSNIVWIENDETLVLNSYLFYFYKVANWKTDDGTIKRLYNDRLLNTAIPVPSLSKQRRIVDCLDKFDTLVNDLTSGLPAEIEVRRKQYEYYRDRLLTFPEKK
jgi:putative type I restiction/modification specificity protein (fragment)